MLILDFVSGSLVSVFLIKPTIVFSKALLKSLFDRNILPCLAAIIEASLIMFLISDGHEDKAISNLQEAYSRGAKIILIADKNCIEKATFAHLKIEIPNFESNFKSLLSPFLMAIPAQLLAYHVANERGTDVDQPRNLAKSVTVE